MSSKILPNENEGVRELLKECAAERWRSSYEPCEKCILQGSDGRCLKTQLWDAIDEDHGIDKVITLYSQIREKISNESKNN